MIFIIVILMIFFKCVKILKNLFLFFLLNEIVFCKSRKERKYSVKVEKKSRVLGVLKKSRVIVFSLC